MVMITEKKIGLSTSSAAVRIRWRLSVPAPAPLRGMVVGQMTEDVLHHDHGGIDDDAEVDRADRQQVGGFAAQHRDHHGEEQRHRNGGRYDDRAAQIAEEYPLDGEDQRNPEQHVVQHGFNRNRHQIAAVVERLDVHPGRQRTVGIDTLDGGADALHHLHRAFELLHQHDAGDDVGGVVAARDTKLRHEADLNLRHIRQQDRHAALLGQDDVADVLERTDDADAAYVDRLLADRDRPAADIGIAGRNRRDHLRQGQAVGHHPAEIDLGLELLGLAAEHQHVGNAGHDSQPALHHPVLQRLELHDVHAGRPAQFVAEDFADGPCRRDHGLHAGRQFDVREPVDDLLAHEVVIPAILELNADEAQAVDRVRADEPQAGRAGKRNLDRDRDVALHFLRRLPGALGDDLDNRRGRVRIGLDVELQEGDVAEAKKCRERDHNQRAPRQAERDQTTQHERTRTRRLSLTPLVVDEDRAADDDGLVRLQTAADLHKPGLLDPDLDDATLEHQRLDLDPDADLIAFPDQRA